MITAALIYISYAYTLSIALLCSGGVGSQSQIIEGEAYAPEHGDRAILEALDN